MKTPQRRPSTALVVVRPDDRAPRPAPLPVSRPDLVPLALLGMPLLLALSLALAPLLGAWVLVVTALGVAALIGLAGWSTGGGR